MKYNDSMVTVLHSPSRKLLDEIGIWLLAEYQENGNGFYCNWNLIQSAFDTSTLTIILVSNIPIGFATWFKSKHRAKLDIVEIKPSFRGKGYGQLLVSELFKFFLRKRIYVVELHCQPLSSETFWKKIGFVSYPDSDAFADYNNNQYRHLYKILVSSLEPEQIPPYNETIELWNDEPYATRDISASWLWSVSFYKDGRKLIKPIIFPCHYDWRIRWKKGDLVIKDDKTKYFIDEKDIVFGNFMIIKDLPLIDSKC